MSRKIICTNCGAVRRIITAKRYSDITLAKGPCCMPRTKRVQAVLKRFVEPVSK